ncbi:MAG: thymidine phosphorylase, partial [Kiritimatiellia bacterium]
MLPQWVIEKKRDGFPLGAEEIRFFIHGYTRGEIPDYQMAALAMAIYFRGMSFEELCVWTESMLATGETVDTSSIARPKVDKHSTGGVGDKVSLVLAPLVACCGIAVPMISGRGLGITGGTLDKLESIPGYRTNLSVREFLRVLEKCGCSIVGQTEQLVPADRKLYALRDVTGTVPAIPLIAASIMSKKLAEGIDALVFDVKWGAGAFMKSLTQAGELAETMIKVGQRLGCRTAALLTDMRQPLGRTAGNALEVAEAVETLQGRGPADLVELTLELGTVMLQLGGCVENETQGRALLEKHLEAGAGLTKFQEMVRWHGGNEQALGKMCEVHRPRFSQSVLANKAGFVSRADAELIGKACLVLGAGRCRVEDRVDYAVGASGIKKIGEPVEKG